MNIVIYLTSLNSWRACVQIKDTSIQSDFSINFELDNDDDNDVAISGVENKRHRAYNDLWTLLRSELDWK